MKIVLMPSTSISLPGILLQTASSFEDVAVIIDWSGNSLYFFQNYFYKSITSIYKYLCINYLFAVLDFLNLHYFGIKI